MILPMKDSGVEWIGHVPEQWPVLPIRRSASLRKDRRTDYPSSSLYVGMEDVESGTGKYAPTEGSSRLGEDSTVGIFDTGNVLYGKLRPYLRKSMTATFAGACSTEFLVMEPHKVLPAWLSLWLLTGEVTQQIEASCEGAKMPRADWESIGAIPMPVPPLSVQQLILDDLDRATARIDALVAKKTRFIELLREKRQATITHAVTKGLDRSVPMKDSGVEWLGETPETWDAAPLKSLLRLRRDVVGADSATTKLLSLTLQGVIERDLDNPTGKMPASFDGYQRISAGEMVFCLFDIDETPRTVGVAPQDGMITGAYTVFRPASELWARYLYYFFLHVDEYKRLKPFYKGLRKTIRSGPFLSIQVPRPSEKAAKEIVNHLDRVTTRIDALITKTERSIELLREHRTALITAAVTGKIDLRPKA